MDSNLLKSVMVRHGLTGADMAEACGISYSAWLGKMAGRSDFTVGDVRKISARLGLTYDLIGEIFFGDNNENNSH